MQKSLALISAGGILGAAVLFAPMTVAGPIKPPAPDRKPAATYSPTQSFAPLVKAVQPAVVALTVEQSRHLTSFGPFAPPQTREGKGSGFVISSDGLVLTNAHVVQGADTITAVLGDGSSAQARVLGLDRNMDVALLRLEGDQDWEHVPLGDSTGLDVGDWVLAMGNPLGLGHTVTAGIVSGKGRVLGHDSFGNEDFIQTDAAINKGNSGGPLFNLNGEVVGINTAIVAGANTIGFAIPIDAVETVLQDLEHKGKVVRGYVGLRPIPLTPRIAGQLGVQVRDGAVVAEIYEGTPAASSQLEPGDLIVAVDGTAVDSPQALIRTIGNQEPGTVIALDVLRGEDPKRIRLELGERPSDYAP